MYVKRHAINSSKDCPGKNILASYTVHKKAYVLFCESLCKVSKVSRMHLHYVDVCAVADYTLICKQSAITMHFTKSEYNYSS